MALIIIVNVIVIMYFIIWKDLGNSLLLDNTFNLDITYFVSNIIFARPIRWLSSIVEMSIGFRFALHRIVPGLPINQ